MRRLSRAAIRRDGWGTGLFIQPCHAIEGDQQDWHDGAATQARIAAREVVSLESSGPFGYHCGLKSDSREMSVEITKARRSIGQSVFFVKACVDWRRDGEANAK
ncbi:MAG: hypothetical protein ACYTFA_06505 [Planctomycetota bacterium]